MDSMSLYYRMCHVFILTLRLSHVKHHTPVKDLSALRLPITLGALGVNSGCREFKVSRSLFYKYIISGLEMTS